MDGDNGLEAGTNEATADLFRSNQMCNTKLVKIHLAMHYWWLDTRIHKCVNMCAYIIIVVMNTYTLCAIIHIYCMKPSKIKAK